MLHIIIFNRPLVFPSKAFGNVLATYGKFITFEIYSKNHKITYFSTWNIKAY